MTVKIKLSVTYSVEIQRYTNSDTVIKLEKYNSSI